MSAPALVDRVAEHIPRAGLAQLVATLDEIQRRASSGHRAPAELTIVLLLDERTGTVVAVELRKRYGWVDV
jgi:hypothetical protein